MPTDDMADDDLIVILRHALAGRKLSDPAADAARPLDARGRRTALALRRTMLDHIVPGAILSSPLARCTETVEPLARAIGLDVGVDDALRVEASAAELASLLRAVPPHAVVCTHGEVIDRLFAMDGACAKGAFLVVRRRSAALEPVLYVPPPRADVGVLVGAGAGTG